MPYSYLMTSRNLFSAQYHRQHYTLQLFEQFGALYMHNLDDKHPTQPGFEPSSFEPQSDWMSHRGRPPVATNPKFILFKLSRTDNCTTLFIQICIHIQKKLTV